MHFQNLVNNQKPTFDHVEPVLPVSNISESVSYWHEVLGFPEKWTWGDPPNHAGLIWDSVHIQLSLNPAWKGTDGHCIWVRVRQLEALYDFHQKNKADIVTPLEYKAWGFDEYVIKELNGHYVVFTAPGVNNQATSKQKKSVTIIERAPNFEEVGNLMNAVNWSILSQWTYKQMLQSTVYAVVAENAETHEVIGCAFLLGDSKSFYYVKDVIVHPQWQRQQVGTKMMRSIEQWLDKNAPEGSTAGLFCGEHLAPFYKQFKFMQACGMYRVINHKT